MPTTHVAPFDSIGIGSSGGPLYRNYSSESGSNGDQRTRQQRKPVVVKILEDDH